MVRDVDISELKEAAYNPRVKLEPGMPEYEKLLRSIQQFGNVEPIVWNERTGNVVGGHQRLTVLKNLGYTEVPCSIVNLDEKDEKLLNVALNKIKGEWDYAKLEDILRGFDYEVATASGFAAEEIAVILANNEDLLADDGDDEDFSMWDDSDEDTIVGGSFVVTLTFENAECASEWAEQHGYKDQIREGSQTTVIRIEQLDEEDNAE